MKNLVRIVCLISLIWLIYFCYTNTEADVARLACGIVMFQASWQLCDGIKGKQ